MFSSAVIRISLVGRLEYEYMSLGLCLASKQPSRWVTDERVVFGSRKEWRFTMASCR